MQIFSEDFKVDAVCIALPFVLKYQDFGPPQTSSGTAPLDYLYDENYAVKYATSCYAAWRRVRLVGPRTSRLAL